MNWVGWPRQSGSLRGEDFCLAAKDANSDRSGSGTAAVANAQSFCVAVLMPECLYTAILTFPSAPRYGHVVSKWIAVFSPLSSARG